MWASAKIFWHESPSKSASVRGLIREVSKEIICYKKVSCSGFDPSFQALNLNRVSITISGIPRLEPNLAQHVQPIIKLSPHQSPLKREARMVWIITTAVFLATVVATLLAFLLFSQKEQIKKALKEKRKEERTKLEIELELATSHEPPLYEKYSAENTSRHGTRIISTKRWQPHEHVFVRLPCKKEPLWARIAYCDALPANAFAIGLQFPSAVDDWLARDV